MIYMSSAAIDAIRHHRSFPRAHAFGIRDQEMQTTVAPDGSPALRIHVDPTAYFPALRSPYVDDFYALLLTSCGGTTDLALPQTLPQHLVDAQIDLAETALLELPDLSGHEKLDIAGSFSRARHSRPVVRVPAVRAVSSSEASVLAEAHSLQTTLAPMLRSLDRKLASYHVHLAKSGLQALVSRLGMQAELGSKLALDMSGHVPVPNLAATSRYHLIDCWRRTQNRLSAFQELAEAQHVATIANRNWLDVPTLKVLHAALLERLPDQERAGKFRSGAVEVCSAFDGEKRTVLVGEPDVEPAYEALTRGFDIALWRGIHPLIRAGMAQLAFLQLKPYAGMNSAFSRLLLHGLLMEGGFPALPIDSVFASNEDTYLLALQKGRSGDSSAYLAYLLAACTEAIPLGRRMLDVMLPECTALREAFAKDAGPRLAGKLAEFAGSMILGPDRQAIRRTCHGSELSWRVGVMDQFDEVDVSRLSFDLCGCASDRAWSNKAARELMTAPLGHL
jgi:hypothetical protein